MNNQNNYIEHTLENCPDLKQFNLDVVYLKMAREWAKNSYSKRSQVGCLVVKNKTIISDGYNGTPTGFPNICEDEDNNSGSKIAYYTNLEELDWIKWVFLH